jgi:hypothetical protein
VPPSDSMVQYDVGPSSVSCVRERSSTDVPSTQLYYVVSINMIAHVSPPWTGTFSLVIHPLYLMTYDISNLAQAIDGLWTEFTEVIKIASYIDVALTTVLVYDSRK